MFIKDLVKKDTLLAFFTAIIIYYLDIYCICFIDYKRKIKKSILFSLKFVMVFLILKNVLNI